MPFREQEKGTGYFFGAIRFRERGACTSPTLGKPHFSMSSRYSNGTAGLFLRQLALTGVLLSLTSCTYQGAKYTPHLRAPFTEDPIPIKVRALRLVDKSPPEDKVNGYLIGSGASATSPEILDGELDYLVTAVLLGKFKAVHVFEKLEEDLAAPDAIMTGTIYRFYERINDPIISICCGALGAFLGLPLSIERGEVDLELVLITIDGRTIGNYRRRIDFNKWTNLYDGEDYDLGDYLDQAFSEVIQQIRDAIVRDRDRIIGSIKR
jgi:hypothetical protein